MGLMLVYVVGFLCCCFSMWLIFGWWLLAWAFGIGWWLCGFDGGCLFAVIADGDLLGFGFGGEFLIVLVLRFL